LVDTKLSDAAPSRIRAVEVLSYALAPRSFVLLRRQSREGFPSPIMGLM
jgi:hypothetical protein